MPTAPKKSKNLKKDAKKPDKKPKVVNIANGKERKQPPMAKAALRVLAVEQDPIRKGLTAKEVAEETGYTAHYVAKIRGSKIYRETKKQIEKRLEDQIMDARPSALRTIIDLAQNAQHEGVKLQAAKDILGELLKEKTEPDGNKKLVISDERLKEIPRDDLEEIAAVIRRHSKES
jgi:hypothetical protein